MTSKTFKSTSGGFSLSFHPNENGVQFRMTDMRGNYHQFTTPPEVAAEQSLAILEAAGVNPTVPAHALFEYGTKAHLENIFLDLAHYVEASKKRTAQAKEWAELEAEALELFKASGAYGSDRLFLKFSDLEETTQSAWLAVARRARELAKEATK